MTSAIQVLIDKNIKIRTYKRERVSNINVNILLFLELCNYLKSFTKFASLLNVSISPTSEVQII